MSYDGLFYSQPIYYHLEANHFPLFSSDISSSCRIINRDLSNSQQVSAFLFTFCTPFANVGT